MKTLKLTNFELPDNFFRNGCRLSIFYTISVIPTDTSESILNTLALTMNVMEISTLLCEKI